MIDFFLWLTLLFQRGQSLQDAIKKGQPSIWLTFNPMRINFYNPDSPWFAGSSPIEKVGLFNYRTFTLPGGKPELKQSERAIDWVVEVMK